MTRVLTIGTFDRFHEGHHRLLQRAASFGELHIGVNSDSWVREYKDVPAQSYLTRKTAVILWGGTHARHVHWNGSAGLELILIVKPDLLVIGSDWHDRNYPKQLGTTANDLAALGVGVLYLPRTPGISSTQLREAEAACA